MTDCAGCGDCCERVAPLQSVPDLRRKLADPYYVGWNRNQAEKIVQMLTERVDPAVDWTPPSRPTYRCKHFNAETRLCEAYDQRPWMCAGYPWYPTPPIPFLNTANYVEKPIPERIPLDFSPRCSFIADIRPLLPLIPV